MVLLAINKAKILHWDQLWGCQCEDSWEGARSILGFCPISRHRTHPDSWENNISKNCQIHFKATWQLHLGTTPSSWWANMRANMHVGSFWQIVDLRQIGFFDIPKPPSQYEWPRCEKLFSANIKGDPVSSSCTSHLTKLATLFSETIWTFYCCNFGIACESLPSITFD